MPKWKNQEDIKLWKRAAVTFKVAWLKELIKTVDSKMPKPMELGSIFNFSDQEGVTCKIVLKLSPAVILLGETFRMNGKWIVWKDILQNIHLNFLAKLRRLKSECSINNLFMESTIVLEMRLENHDRQRSSDEQVKSLIDCFASNFHECIDAISSGDTWPCSQICDNSRQLEKQNLDLKKIVSFTSDRASVMLGKGNCFAVSTGATFNWATLHCPPRRFSHWWCLEKGIIDERYWNASLDSLLDF